MPEKLKACKVPKGYLSHGGNKKGVQATIAFTKIYKLSFAATAPITITSSDVQTLWSPNPPSIIV